MSRSRESVAMDRPITSSLPVKPVTPRTWNKVQLESGPEVSVYENEMYGSSRGRYNSEKDTIPSYQPLSALSRPTTMGMGADNNVSRPVSRLGMPRGQAATSKFVVPPLNLEALKQPLKPEASNITSNGVYLRNQGLPVAPPSLPVETAGAAEDTKPTALKERIQPPQARPAPMKINLNTLMAQKAAAASTLPQPTAPKDDQKPVELPSSRPLTRLGRPLSSLASNNAAQQPLSSELSSKFGSLRSHLPSAEFKGSYRSSDHNELLIKASGWIERPSSSKEISLQKRPSVEATAAWVTASKNYVIRNSLSTSNGSRPSSAAMLTKVSSSIIPRLSNYAAARRFLLAPGPVNEPLRCRVERRKTGLLGTTTNYIMLLEEGECVMLNARRHHRATGAASFDIFVAPPAGAPQDSSICVAKLNASFMGTEYVLIGAGMEEGGATVGPESGGVTYGFSAEPANDTGKRSSGIKMGAGKGGEMGAIMYTPNIMGTKGPRKAAVLLPKLVPSGESAWELQPATVDGALTAKYKQGDTSECIVLRNRPPRWNATLGAYCLHFGGRVTHASVKNIQLVSSDDPDRVVLQFGRVGSDEFTLDYQFPITPLQAFAIALASLDPKLGCE